MVCEMTWNCLFGNVYSSSNSSRCVHYGKKMYFDVVASSLLLLLSPRCRLTLPFNLMRCLPTACNMQKANKQNCANMQITLRTRFHLRLKLFVLSVILASICFACNCLWHTLDDCQSFGCRIDCFASRCSPLHRETNYFFCKSLIK